MGRRLVDQMDAQTDFHWVGLWVIETAALMEVQ